MKRALPMLCLAALAAAGCGAGSKSGSTSASTAATAGAAPFTTAQVRSLAAAVNLRAGDLPGFKATSTGGQHKSGAETAQSKALRTCLGVEGVKAANLELESPSFERQTASSTQTVDSEVEGMADEAAVISIISASRAERARGCLVSFLRRLFNQSGTATSGSVSGVTVTPKQPPAPGTVGSFGWQMAATFILHGVQVPLHLDVQGFGVRNALVVLVDDGFPTPFPASLESSLFGKLVVRALEFKR